MTRRRFRLRAPYWWDGLWLWVFGAFPLGVLVGIVIAELAR